MFTKLNTLFAPQTAKLKNAIEETPSRQYYMGLALVVLVLIKFFFVPWFEEVSTRQAQLQQMADSVKTPKLMLEQTELMKQALIDKKQLHEQWLNNFYQGSTSQVKVAVVNKLQASARAKGLLYLRSRWLKTPADKLEEYSTLEPLIYTVLVRGDYNEIRKLIQEWQDLKPFIRIEELEIDKRKEAGVAAATFKIAVFRIKEGDANNEGGNR